jgi:hypothetical protein
MNIFYRCVYNRLQALICDNVLTRIKLIYTQIITKNDWKSVKNFFKILFIQKKKKKKIENFFISYSNKSFIQHLLP